MQKIYCYVDESGQDVGSAFFVVVVVISFQDQGILRQELTEIEKVAKTGGRKWHKSRSERRMKYLRMALERKIGKGDVFFGRYKKPLPYFLPILEMLEKAIKKKARGMYKARVYIDGIDHKKASELTNALRLRSISLEHIKSRRDESEPLIRLADMWAGCVRGALLGHRKVKAIVVKAKQARYLYEVTK